MSLVLDSIKVLSLCIVVGKIVWPEYGIFGKLEIKYCHSVATYMHRNCLVGTHNNVKGYFK